jgi:iron(III) transport system substrate-binding protein
MTRFGVVALLLWSVPAGAAAPEPTPVTPDLVAAAEKEGRIVFYTSIELRLAELLGKSFESRYPGIAVQVERSGAERIFQRVSQEETSDVHAADVVESSDMAHALAWKRAGLLAPFVPAVLAAWPAEERDPDGCFAADRRTRRRALPTCSIRAGRARSSKRTPATAVRS